MTLSTRVEQLSGADRAIYRVQDKWGRGPYRPGLSKHWSDPDGPECKPWWLEIGLDIHSAHAFMVGPYHWGCGFRTMDQLRHWFTDREMSKLDALGFGLVTLMPDLVLFETPSQVVFGYKQPLREATRASLKARGL